MNLFFAAQLNHCLLIWMIYSRSNNKRVKCLHERGIRLTYNEKTSSYEEVLEKDRSVSIHLQKHSYTH